jgi:hypothetical protein
VEREAEGAGSGGVKSSEKGNYANAAIPPDLLQHRLTSQRKVNKDTRRGILNTWRLDCSILLVAI